MASSAPVNLAIQCAENSIKGPLPHILIPKGERMTISPVEVCSTDVPIKYDSLSENRSRETPPPPINAQLNKVAWWAWTLCNSLYGYFYIRVGIKTGKSWAFTTMFQKHPNYLQKAAMPRVWNSWVSHGYHILPNGLQLHSFTQKLSRNTDITYDAPELIMQFFTSQLQVLSSSWFIPRLWPSSWATMEANICTLICPNWNIKWKQVSKQKSVTVIQLRAKLHVMFFDKLGPGCPLLRHSDLRKWCGEGVGGQSAPVPASQAQWGFWGL